MIYVHSGVLMADVQYSEVEFKGTRLAASPTGHQRCCHGVQIWPTGRAVAPMHINHSYMVVSQNRATRKSSVLMGFSIINHPLWVPPFWETSICFLCFQVLDYTGMRSEGFSFTLRVSGWSCVRSTLLLRPQPFAARPSCAARPWCGMGSAAKVVTLGLEVSNVAQRRFVWRGTL